MENKKAYKKALKHILCCIIIIILFVITISRVNALSLNNLSINSSLSFKSYITNIFKKKELIKIKKYDKPRIIKNNIEIFIDEYEQTLKFFANMYGYNFEFIKKDLKDRNKEVLELDKNNIGCLKDKNSEMKSFKNVEHGISEYFIELTKKHPEKRNKNIKEYTGSSEYIENLIIYYSNIYDIDTNLALSIGAAESGYYKVKYMLKKNNVYGGMGKNGLIRYDNIEVGVLKYIRLLSNNYFNKGLTTPESIGRKYCPQINENGQKVASSHWLNLVKKAQKKYKDYTQDITINDLV